MRLLLFIDSNLRTIPYEIPLLQLRSQGYELLFLSLLEKGPIHQEYEQYNIQVFSMGEKKVTLKHLFRYLFFFIKFCKRQKVDVVFAHLSIPSLIGVLGKYFISAKVLCFRHHFNFVNLSKKAEFKINKVDVFMDHITAKLASKIILPSQYLKELIQANEGVPAAKLEVIPYAYDWSRFLERSRTKPVMANKSLPLKLLMISRLTKLKRPNLAIAVLSALHRKGIDAVLTIVGTGDLENTLKDAVITTNLAGSITFVGFQNDVVPYIIESDFLLHPSLTEASSSVIKEAGVLGLPVIVCNGVGDFNDYIRDGVNGWLVDPDNFVTEAQTIIESTTNEKQNMIGQALRKTILNRFSVTDSLVDSYVSLIS